MSHSPFVHESAPVTSVRVCLTGSCVVAAGHGGRRGGAIVAVVWICASKRVRALTLRVSMQGVGLDGNLLAAGRVAGRRERQGPHEDDAGVRVQRGKGDGETERNPLLSMCTSGRLFMLGSVPAVVLFPATLPIILSMVCGSAHSGCRQSVHRRCLPIAKHAAIPCPRVSRCVRRCHASRLRCRFPSSVTRAPWRPGWPFRPWESSVAAEEERTTTPSRPSAPSECDPERAQLSVRGVC